jgi:sugar-specific transcriptional regulator TrmB
MTLRSEQMETLRQLGLGDYAARAYLALLDLGETEARDVSRLSGVPLAKMYQVLESLQAKGLCDVFPETPKRFAPVHFARYVAQLATEHRKAADAVDARREALVAQFPIGGEARASDRGRIQTVSGRKMATDHETRLLLQAKARVLLLCTPGRLLHMLGHSAEWEAAHARGVELRLLVSRGPRLADAQAAFSPIADLRVQDPREDPRGTSVSFMLVDDTDALVLDRIPDDERSHRGHDVGLHVAQEGLVCALRDMLEALWERAAAGPPARASSVLLSSP